MNTRSFRTLLLCVCLFAGMAAMAHAQGKPPGGGGPGGPPHGPGGPGGPGGPPPGGGGGGFPLPGSGSNPATSSNSARGGLQVGPVGRWWDDKQVVKTIGLRKDQQKSMDTIFNANKAAIVASYKTLLTEQARLDALTRQSQVDKNQTFASIDAVSQARASLEKANAQMLLQIRQQLDTEQLTRLQNLH